MECNLPGHTSRTINVIYSCYIHHGELRLALKIEQQSIWTLLQRTEPMGESNYSSKSLQSSFSGPTYRWPCLALGPLLILPKHPPLPFGTLSTLFGAFGLLTRIPYNTLSSLRAGRARLGHCCISNNYYRINVHKKMFVGRMNGIRSCLWIKCS